MPWANQILPAVGVARDILAEEDDAASVISVASSGAPSRQKAGDSDSDSLQQSKVDGQGDNATVVEVFKDEDEFEAESEEEFELSENVQRLLHEAYETFATSGERWIHQRGHSSASCRTPFADAGNVRAVFDKFIDLLFFFSNAARTITALTVMRSGRKLRHLDNVGSHSKQHKNKTQPKTTKTKHNRPKGFPKSENKGETV